MDIAEKLELAREQIAETAATGIRPAYEIEISLQKNLHKERAGTVAFGQ